MASVVVFVRPARKEKGEERPADLRSDKIGRPIVHSQDVDTNQFITVYEKKGQSIFTEDMVGKTVVFNGTLHPLFENVKMIATAGEIVS